MTFSLGRRADQRIPLLVKSSCKLFPAALASLMQECDLNQVELSQRSGVTISRVNNYLSARYRTVTPKHAAAIFNALPGSPESRAALCQAYLFDLLPDTIRGMVDIRLVGAKDSGKWEVPSKHLPTDFARAMRDLYILCASDVKVRERTAEWIQIMREVAAKARRSSER